MNKVKIIQLDRTLTAARVRGKTKIAQKVAILRTIEKLADALNLQSGEKLFCFASPHAGPVFRKGKSFHLPPGFGFVIVDPKTTYDKGSVKFAFWIEHFGRVADNATCTTFFTADGCAQIADDQWVHPDRFAEEMSQHLRTGKEMNYYLSSPEKYVTKILPLLHRAA